MIGIDIALLAHPSPLRSLSKTALTAIKFRWILWLDAAYLKVRDGGRIVSVAAIIAVAVTTEGRREIVGLGLGPSEAEPFWSTFLKGLVKRGLKGVKLVISDAHDGLRLAITRVLGASW
jgi:transposase-like protein